MEKIKELLKTFLYLSVVSKTMFSPIEDEINFEEIGHKELLSQGFTEVDVLTEEGEGVVIISPEGHEIYREIPKREGWKQRLLTSILKENEN